MFALGGAEPPQLSAPAGTFPPRLSHATLSNGSAQCSLSFLSAVEWAVRSVSDVGPALLYGCGHYD